MNQISEMINDGCLLTSGTIDNFNTMTIGWGMMGTIYRKDTFICFVRHSRYTYEFLEKNDFFTISFYYPRYRYQLSYLGTNSGRDGNKVEHVGFTPVMVENGVTFKEAYLTFVCKKIYFQDMDLNNLDPQFKEKYYPNGDIHCMYFGEVIKVLDSDSIK